MATKINVFLLLICIIMCGCTEPYTLVTNTYEEALVVEATITNEIKTQEITLRKTSQFEDKETHIEAGAEVFIIDNTGTQYDFKEESGKYISTVEFQAISGREYQLHIKTKDGRSFESSTENLSPNNPIQDIKAVVETNDNIRGVSIRVYNNDATNTAKYYRYKYEETYKIISPNWNSIKATVIPALNDTLYPSIKLITNSIKTRVCYGAKNSTDIILTSTTELNENRVDFPVRFISDQNYIISHRYSILVHQYTENLAAYTYYKKLQKISNSGSLLSPIQPGFLYGNIKSIKNPDDKIIGYFDVASISTKRIYFNYVDLFPLEALPPYYTKCEEVPFKFCFKGEGCYGRDLVSGIKHNEFTYVTNQDIHYKMVPAPCGDCTTFSSNIKPLFWED
jgi:hypothetical protein